MHDGLDIAFNGLWADNGDAISREYAGTSALKVSLPASSQAIQPPTSRPSSLRRVTLFARASATGEER